MELQQQYIEQAINLHNNNPVVDAHLDLAAELVYRVRNGEMNPLRTYYLKNLRAAGVNLVVSSVYYFSLSKSASAFGKMSCPALRMAR